MKFLNTVFFSALFTVGYSISAMSQTIVRTALVDKYKIEISMDMFQSGIGVNNKTYLQSGVVDDPCDMTPVYSCVSELKMVSGVKLKYSLYSQGGQLLDSKIANAVLIANSEVEVSDNKAVCTPAFKERAKISTYSIENQVSLNDGQTKIPLSTMFSGLTVINNNNFQFTLDSNSLKTVNFYLSSARGYADLFDPAHPPVQDPADNEDPDRHN